LCYGIFLVHLHIHSVLSVELNKRGEGLLLSSLFLFHLTHITLLTINDNIKMIPDIIPAFEAFICIVIKQIGYKKREDIASLV